MTEISLTSLPIGYRAAVFGATGGIGAAFVNAFLEDPRCGHLFAGSRQGVEFNAQITPFSFNLCDEGSIAAAVQSVTTDGPLDIVIVATGILHAGALRPEKTYRALDADVMQRSYAINAIGPALIAKHVLPNLPRHRKSVFAALSARVGSIGDNATGGWHAYRASKAALNMLVRNCAIELAVKNKHAVCVVLHPGTVDTALSKPFKSGVTATQLFSPAQSAAALLRVVEELSVEDSGGFFAWNGQSIPF